MSETTESPKRSQVDLILELAETKNSLAEAQESILYMSEMIQRDHWIQDSLQPIVDLIALWREELGDPKKDENPAHTVALFSKSAAMQLGLYPKWRALMGEKYDLDLTPLPVDDTDASR